MGVVIDYNRVPDEETLGSKLFIYMANLREIVDSKSVGKELADELLKCAPDRRSMKLEQIFIRVLDGCSDGTIIRDIDVMFNLEYQVDVLKLMISARKRKKYSVIWPGSLKDNKLIYAEEGYQDYKVFDLEDYDIICVR